MISFLEEKIDHKAVLVCQDIQNGTISNGKRKKADGAKAKVFTKTAVNWLRR